MEIKRSFILFIFVSFLFNKSVNSEKKSYIVYLGGHPEILDDASLLFEEERRKDAHYELLGTILGSKENAQDAIFYSYTKYINGFAAVLEEEEARDLSKNPNVLSLIPNEAYKLHTTHSWDFLGLEENGQVNGGSLWNKARFGEDTIIAHLDTGVWPESKSFNDEGLGPIPSRWKGGCEKGFPCNRKLIGARHFNKGYLANGGKIDPRTDSPRDHEGHGSHTLSTAAGSFVANVSYLNNAKGTAKGGSPKARVATYKVCWIDDCMNSDILAGFEAAIHDGVDVISVSVGGPTVDYLLDTFAIGSFHAVKKGIAVVCSAGNSGPLPGSVTNVAPWILTVGASTIDRDITTYLSLGKKKHIQGKSFSSRGLRAFKPIIRAEDAKVSNASVGDARLCIPGTLDPKKVKGNIVVCVRSGRIALMLKGLTVLDAGGAGMVIANNQALGDDVPTIPYLLPTIHISYSDSLTVFSYLNSTKIPYAFITAPKTEIGVKRAPLMAPFSSQGPNKINPEILKPDITAPGVDILAAFTPEKSPSDMDFDKRRVGYKFLSGTSMSCPHIAGIIGLFKTLHPDWSLSAMKSALMTTAMTQDNKGGPLSNTNFEKETPFSYGSGHVHPNRAMDPGLVYDLTVTDYLNFLCSVGYNSSQVAAFSGITYSCPSKSLNIKDFNYPSIAVPNFSGSITVERRVKNVGTPGTYHAQVSAPRGISVSVKPVSLEFKKIGEELKFTVTLTAKALARAPSKPGGEYVFGTLIWSDGNHLVRSQIAVNVRK